MTAHLLALLLLAFTPAAGAQGADERLAYDMQVELSLFWDQLNLTTTQLYQACFCHVLQSESRRVRGHQLCTRVDKTITNFTTTTINHAGDAITISEACSGKVRQLLTQANESMRRVRQELALAQDGLGDINRQAQGGLSENASAIRHDPRYAITIDLHHPLETGIQTPMDPLDAQEVEEILKVYFKESEKIAGEFLQSPEYIHAYGKFNLAQRDLTDLLLARDKLAQDRISAAIHAKRDHDPRYQTIDYLLSMFQRFASPLRQQFRDEHMRNYVRTLDYLPPLQLIRGKQVDLVAYLETLGPVSERALKRRDLTKQRAEGALPMDLAAFDNILALDSLTDALKVRHKWSDEKVEEVVGKLVAERGRQVRNANLKAVGSSVGILLSCIAVYPLLKTARPLLRVLVPNLCFTGISIGVNSYFINANIQQRKALVTTWLSTPDGWNQITRLSEILALQDELEDLLVFSLLDVIPIVNMLKLF